MEIINHEVEEIFFELEKFFSASNNLSFFFFYLCDSSKSFFFILKKIKMIQEKSYCTKKTILNNFFILKLVKLS